MRRDRAPGGLRTGAAPDAETTPGPVGPGRRALRIGLTGPIGCGKSTVARWLAERGAVVVDADGLAREVVARGTPGFDAIVASFGPDVLGRDGDLDRAALGRIVFADPEALRRLEAIVHPAVRPRILAAIADAEATGTAVVVLEAIRLVDGGYAALLDEIWFVTCDAAVQRDRLLRRGVAPDVAEQRMAAQGELVARARAAATRVLDASGDVQTTVGLVATALAEDLERRGTAGRGA